MFVPLYPPYFISGPVSRRDRVMNGESENKDTMMQLYS
jgi:hypothetical protein